MLLAVAGCVAQAEGAEIVARQPAVDWWWGRNPITACRR
jgi:tRNA A37 methylthiotransferase MiaB